MKIDFTVTAEIDDAKVADAASGVCSALGITEERGRMIMEDFQSRIDYQLKTTAERPLVVNDLKEFLSFVTTEALTGEETAFLLFQGYRASNMVQRAVGGLIFGQA